MRWLIFLLACGKRADYVASRLAILALIHVHSTQEPLPHGDVDGSLVQAVLICCKDLLSSCLRGSGRAGKGIGERREFERARVLASFFMDHISARLAKSGISASEPIIGGLAETSRP